jgi:hypothetical protein
LAHLNYCTCLSVQGQTRGTINPDTNTLHHHQKSFNFTPSNLNRLNRSPKSQEPQISISIRKRNPNCSSVPLDPVFI